MSTIEMFSEESLNALLITARTWVWEDVLTIGTGVQVAVLLAILMLSRVLAPPLKQWISKWRNSWVVRLKSTLVLVTRPSICLLLLWMSILVLSALEILHNLIEITASLLAAWIVIRIASKFVRNSTLARSIAWFAWFIAALNILQFLNPLIEILDSRAVTFGDVRVSAYTLITTTLALTILLWLASQSSKFFEQRIKSNRSLSPSVQVLMTKAFTIVVIGLAVVISLQAVGIDLTALAVVGGAIGLGIGFGLQKIVANLISGVILLLDKSIKPGDVIAVDQTYGWVDALGARYVSVITRDGTEHLIPNETLITERVENWTHSNESRRIRVPIGVHYDTDVDTAIALCKESALEVERVIEDPPVACLITEFGDNSVNLEVRFWIRDAQNGIANVKSEVMLRIWRAFHKHDIEIPYPQRDLHIRSIDKTLNFSEVLDQE